MRNPFRRRTRRDSEATAAGAALLLPYTQIGSQLALQVDSFRAAMESTAKVIRAKLWPSLSETAAKLADLLASINPTLQANTELHVAGLEARYYVRAGLDPTYAEPWMLDVLVQSLLTGEGDALLLYDENRARVAAAAIAGWCASYAGASTVRVLAWHRHMPSGQRLSVGRAS